MDDRDQASRSDSDTGHGKRSFRAFRAIALAPTLVSIALSLVFHVVLLRSSEAPWPTILRDTLFFLMQSEILLLALSLVIHFSDFQPFLYSLVVDRETRKFLRLICEAHERYFPEDAFFSRRLTDLVHKFSGELRPLHDGDFYCASAEILTCTSELYALTRRKINSVSLVDIAKYWASNDFRPAAFALIRLARTRGVAMERIFVFQRLEEISLHRQLLQDMAADGVVLLYALLAELPVDLRFDFSLYEDDRYLQVSEFEEHSFNKTFSRHLVSSNEETVARFQKIYSDIRNRAKQIDLQKMPGKPGATVWSSREILDHYTGSAPDLHLETLHRPPNRVLDVGCGAGRTLEVFLKMGISEVVGIDDDPMALDLCRQRFPTYGNLTLVQERFPSDSLRGQQFDAIVAFNSLYHCTQENMFGIIDKIHSLLRPDGYALITIKTIENNAEAIKGGAQIEPNTWLGCNMPDFDKLHHFSTPEEIELIISRFARLILKERISLVSRNNVIVQAEGYYLVLQK